MCMQGRITIGAVSLVLSAFHRKVVILLQFLAKFKVDLNENSVSFNGVHF